MKRTQFPLPEGTFKSPRLRSVEIKGYESQIQSLISTSLEEYERVSLYGLGAYSSRWDVIKAAEDHMAIHKRDSGSSMRSQYRLVAKVGANYRDIMGFMHADTSREFYEWMRFVNRRTLDAHVLQTIETGTNDNTHHYYGVKWAMFQSSLLGGKVDQCFIEYMTYQKDLRGRDIGVRVVLPIHLSEVDYTLDNTKVRRLESQVVQIFRPCKESTMTQMFMMVDIESSAAAPGHYIKSLMKLGRKLPSCIESRRMRRRGLMAEKHWVPNHSRRSCTVCARAFGAARGRHHCRMCGEVVCRKCVLKRDAALRGRGKTFKIIKTKICMVCVSKLRSSVYSTRGSLSRAKSSKEVATISGVSLLTVTESEDCFASFPWMTSTSDSWASFRSKPDCSKQAIEQSFHSRVSSFHDQELEDAIFGSPEFPIVDPNEEIIAAEVSLDITSVPTPPKRDSLVRAEWLSSSGAFDELAEEELWSSQVRSWRSINQRLAEQRDLIQQIFQASQGSQR